MRKNKINKQDILSLSFFKKIDWHKIAQYDECILMKYLGFDSFRRKECKEELKKSYKYKTALVFNDVEYLDHDEYIKKIPKYLEKRYRRNKNFLKDYARLTYKNCEDCVNFSLKLKSIKNFNKYSIKEIVEMFDKYILSILKIMPFVYTLTIFENFVINQIWRHLQKKQVRERRIGEYILQLSKPRYKSISQKERNELIKLASEIQQRNLFLKNKKSIEGLNFLNLASDIQLKIKEHQKKYGWMGILFMRGRPYPVSKFFKDLKENLKEDAKSKLKEFIKDEKEIEKRIKNIITIFKIPKGLINALRELAFLRMYRIDMINISNYNALHFLKYIAQKLNMLYKDMLYLTVAEVRIGLINRKKVKELKNKIIERKRGWGIIFYNNELKFIVGKRYKLLKEKIFEKDFSGYDSIRGFVAYKKEEKIIGKAYVAFSSGELDKITTKHILIAPETTVDFEPAMKKAKAIITDRGGILSHAAIVSREFKKPCIVGTSFATKIFKTGDLVEVDAKKGIVKILKK